jgi:Uncharacterised protein family (UPF0149)
MSGLSRRLKQLDEELLALGEETMLLEELDGFIAGLLVCPDLIKPGEWLPIIWNRDSADQQPAFDNLDHLDGEPINQPEWNAIHRTGGQIADSSSGSIVLCESHTGATLTRKSQFRSTLVN